MRLLNVFFHTLLAEDSDVVYPGLS